MATPKSQGVATSISNSGQTGRTKEDIPTLKNKVIELERQVNEYRTKLDGLRRAKATTVVKLEKEYVNTTLIGLNRTEKSKSCEKCEEFERIIETEKKCNLQLKRMIEQKEPNKQQQQQQSSTATTIHSGSCSKCSDLQELVLIEKENNLQLSEQFESEKKETEEERNAKQILDRSLEMVKTELIKTQNVSELLKKENEEYKNSFETMKKEHSEKMAHLFQREEEAKKQVATWEQMYRQWMATMERRVNNLQVTNEDLQTWLQDDKEIAPNRRPDGNGNQRQ